MTDQPPRTQVAQWVVEHHAAVYRLAFRLSGSAEDAEDLTQQVFLVAQQKSEQVRRADSARSWLLATLRNCYLKSRQQCVPIPAAAVSVDVQQIPDAIPEEPIDGEQLQRAIDSLPDAFKLVVLMFYFEQYSYREIAEQLEIPVGTVMSRLSRAKGHLRARLVRQGFATAESRKAPRHLAARQRIVP
jgi:RNA polymerase sigma-70 factor (ECF subfamily)